MKTKFIFMVLALLLLSCNPYPDQDAKILIKSRVSNCIKVDKVYTISETVIYVAIDSLYNTYSFRVSERGQITPLYENGDEVK